MSASASSRSEADRQLSATSSHGAAATRVVNAIWHKHCLHIRLDLELELRPSLRSFPESKLPIEGLRPEIRWVRADH